VLNPRLSVDAMCSFTWSFDQDLALWREMGVHHAGLLAAKMSEDRNGKIAQLRDAGIAPSTIITGPFPLDARDEWDAGRAVLNAAIDLAADAGGDTAYFPPGRATGAPWREDLDLFAEAIAPCVDYGRQHSVRLGFEPSLTTHVSFVNTLRDAIDVSERTGLGLVVDFGHCWMERDLREVLARAAPHICLVQICDVAIGRLGVSPPLGRVYLGDGDLPLARLMEEVLASGYGGMFDLEAAGPSIGPDHYEAALRRGIPRASAWLDELGIG
jgi:sugar phosphate isomerase/epimerase